MARKTELLEEHRKIIAIVRKVKDTTDHDALRPLLSEFRTTLERHFAYEEAPRGLFDTIRETAPEREGEVDTLIRQHQEMLSALKTLIEGQAETDIVVQAHRVADALGEHESAENVLLLDVFNTDIGAGD